MALTRRGLFQLGLGGSLVLVAGGTLRWLSSGYRLLPGEAAIGLGTKELAIARAVVETLLPAGDGFPSGVALGVHQRIDEEVWAAPDAMRADLSAALEVIEHAPLILGHRSRFTRLSPADREAAFLAMLRSERDVVVQVAFALRQMAHAFYYGDAATWGAIGYDGPWVAEPRPPESALRYRELLAARLAQSGSAA